MENVSTDAEEEDGTFVKTVIIIMIYRCDSPARIVQFNDRVLITLLMELNKCLFKREKISGIAQY